MTEVIVIIISLLVYRFLLYPSKKYRKIVWVNYFLFLSFSVLFSLKSGGSESGVDALKFYIKGNGVVFSELSSFSQANFMYALSGMIQSFFPVSYISFNLIGALLFSQTALLLIIRSIPEPNSRFIFFLWVVTLLPGFHYWNAVFGKDSLQLLLIALFFCSGSYLKIIAFICLLLVRPHMAVFLILSVVGQAVLKKGINVKKAVLLLVSIFSLIYAINIISERLLSTADISLFALLDAFESYGGEWKTGGLRLSDTSTPFALFEFLFRPYFWEIDSIAMLASSLENLVLTIFLFYVLFSTTSKYKKQTSWIFILITVVVLSFTNPNVGTAMRKKQVLPLLSLVILATRYRRLKVIKDKI